MKKAASIVTLINAILIIVTTEILSFILPFLIRYEISKAFQIAWMIVWHLYILFMIFILLWRRHSVENGNNIACGIVTLLFVSTIGGILTLCIPKSQLYGISADKINNIEKKESSIVEKNTEEENDLF